MSDDTTLPAATTGGDTIRTISRTTYTQNPTTGVITTTEVKTQAIEILTGPSVNGASPASVSEQNPLYTADASVRRLLEKLLIAIELNTEAIERL